MLCVRVLRNPGNRGKGYAIRHGMLDSTMDWRLLTDADLSAPIEELEKLWNAVKDGAKCGDCHRIARARPLADRRASDRIPRDSGQDVQPGDADLYRAASPRHTVQGSSSSGATPPGKPLQTSSRLSGSASTSKPCSWRKNPATASPRSRFAGITWTASKVGNAERRAIFPGSGQDPLVSTHRQIPII